MISRMYSGQLGRFGFKLLLFFLVATNAAAQINAKIDLQPDEKIWSGVVGDGSKMPYAKGYSFDFLSNNEQNQLQPLLLSSKGLWVWSEDPFAFELQNDVLIISKAKGVVKFGYSGTSLAEARQYASARFFPSSGKMPDELLFSRPQYNTWIELTYHQNQQDVLNYANHIISAGFPPGVLMIDDTWQEDYGLWRFHPGRFPDPKAMIDSLHAMGFKVMLWICPFVSADQAMIVQELMNKKAFLMQQKGEKYSWEKATDPALIHWWNGYSASLDFTNPAAVDWFNAQLDRLTADYKIDGFKFDAGDMDLYPSDAMTMKPATPNDLCGLYAHFGLRFPLNEYRACWKMAGQPLAQRLHDKEHSWKELQNLIPEMIAEQLAGYTFSCPDMIGGGNWVSFLDPKTFNQDLVVRSAQIHALMPMMQFSVAPWRVLDAVHLAAVQKAVAIREKFKKTILSRVRKSAADGDPIICSMEYSFPGQHFENVKDQFMLGDSILVAPVETDSGRRSVQLPEGKWLADDGKAYRGGKTYFIDVPLDRLPYFLRTK